MLWHSPFSGVRKADCPFSVSWERGKLLAYAWLIFNLRPSVDCVMADRMGRFRRGAVEFRSGRIVDRGYGVRDEKLCL